MRLNSRERRRARRRGVVSGTYVWDTPGTFSIADAGLPAGTNAFFRAWGGGVTGSTGVGAIGGNGGGAGGYADKTMAIPSSGFVVVGAAGAAAGAAGDSFVGPNADGTDPAVLADGATARNGGDFGTGDVTARGGNGTIGNLGGAGGAGGNADQGVAAGGGAGGFPGEPGNPGGVPGGGGGGGASTAAGGAGGHGRVTVRWPA